MLDAVVPCVLSTFKELDKNVTVLSRDVHTSSNVIEPNVESALLIVVLPEITDVSLEKKATDAE